MVHVSASLFSFAVTTPVDDLFREIAGAICAYASQLNVNGDFFSAYNAANGRGGEQTSSSCVSHSSYAYEGSTVGVRMRAG